MFNIGGVGNSALWNDRRSKRQHLLEPHVNESVATKTEETLLLRTAVT